MAGKILRTNDQAKGPVQVAVTEDDALLRDQVLVPELREYGFRVEGFGSASELYRGMLGCAFDIVVLDIGLPGESGLSAAAYLRELRPDIGIVMLTGTSTRDHHVRAMRLGADIYLDKPVDTEILAVTLHSLSRRLRGSAAAVPEQDRIPVPLEEAMPLAWRLASDGWCMQTPTGQILALTEPERALLKMLDAHRGRAVGRKELIATLTADIAGFDPHRLEALVSRIRRKAAIAAPDATPLPLLPVRGTGYVLAT